MFTAKQMLTIQVSERCMSVLSIIGSLFIISTFLRWHYFRKPINRLVFYASFGNMLTNIATLISTSALPGQNAPYYSLCEFQGILIQWFMMADALWVFSMAMNVGFVLFCRYDSRRLLRLEKWYLLANYGIPGAISVSYIFANHYGRKKMKVIGPATIWCWVGSDLEWLRIAFFYVPIWFLILLTMIIYICAGVHVLRKRAALRSFSKVADQEPSTTLTNPFTAKDFGNITIETELKVESSSGAASIDRDSLTIFPASRGSFSSTRELAEPSNAHTVSNHRETRRRGYTATAFSTSRSPHPHPEPGTERDPVPEQPQTFSLGSTNTARLRIVTYEGNAAAWGYFKVAFLMFTALFIVWVPSTVNRFRQYTHHGHTSFALNLASAMVLPLQGFWNALIYISTTWAECNRALTDTLASWYRRHDKKKSGKTAAAKGFQRDVEGLEPPIPLGRLGSRSESQRCLQSSSSAETVRAAPAQRES